MLIKRERFGTLEDGTAVPITTLVNDQGMTARITAYGGIVVSLTAPDRGGAFGDVVLGFDTLAEYVDHNPFFGALVGRYGNRIAKGRFELNGETVVLALNDGDNHLHGGVVGFDKVMWDAVAMETVEGPALTLMYVAADGEEGYPGALEVTVVYTLTDDNALRIDYSATTDKTTVVNLTNHSYFNISAGASPTVLDQVLMLAADAFTPVDATLIPTGEIRPVAGTPMDFRTATAIGARIDDEDEQLGYGGGYDHNWVINGQAGELRLAARVSDPVTGRVMEVLTTEPGVQVYTANMMPGTLPGKAGASYGARGAICLETQHYPDSPNKPEFPSTVLQPDERYETTTVYRFGVV